MGLLAKDEIQVRDGKIHFIPSGSTTTGVSQSFNSVAQQYVVSMSGASLSQSILAPVDNTGSYFYLRQPDNYAYKFAFVSTTQLTPSSSTSTAIATGSGISNNITPSSSLITINLSLNITGSDILTQAVNALNQTTLLTNRLAVSSSISSSGENYIYLTNIVTGAPPSDDFSLQFISGSTLSSSVSISGSGIANQLTTTGVASTASANVTWALDDDDKTSAAVTLPDSRSIYDYTRRAHRCNSYQCINWIKHINAWRSSIRYRI